MGKIEGPVIELLPITYSRYIGDCSAVKTTQSKMDELFNILNTQTQYHSIKFTRDVLCEARLPFLNTQIRVRTGQHSMKRYRKGSSKNTIIHVMFTHPSAVKRSVLRNMFRTAVRMYMGEEKHEEPKKRMLTCKIANLT